jgi:hypothetical protein
MLALMEAAVEAVRDALEAALPDKLDDLDSEYNDGIELADPARYDVEEQIEADAFPLIEVLGDETVVLAEDATYLKAKHTLAVACTVQDDTRDGTLRRRVYRYARAIVEVLKEARPSIGYTVQFGSPAVDFSPAFRRRGSATAIAGCTVLVELVKTETHG